jgi:hypothetical protein
MPFYYKLCSTNTRDNLGNDEPAFLTVRMT